MQRKKRNIGPKRGYHERQGRQRAIGCYGHMPEMRNKDVQNNGFEKMILSKKFGNLLPGFFVI